MGYSAFAGPYAEDYEGIHHTNAVFEGWITGVVQSFRPNSSSGGFSRNDSGSNDTVTAAVTGLPGGFATTNNLSHVYSLGNGGSITLSFAAPIFDGAGPDFAVFENAFPDGVGFTYAELAFVEVSSDNVHWVAFPFDYLGTDYVYDLNFNDRYASQDVTLIDGLAGKNIITVGSPFDLGFLSNQAQVVNGNVDLHNINYIRLTDVVGDGSVTDKNGNPVYDPYYNAFVPGLVAATPLSTDGFDLRAIGVLHHATPVVHSHANLQWTAHNNALYQVEFSPSLTPPAWTNYSGVITGSTQQISTALPDEEHGFLRIRKWRP